MSSAAAAKQSRARADVFARDGVRSAAARVRIDGLAIGKVDDGEQKNDGAADRDDVGNAQRAERDQDSERGFWTVCGGTKRVESEDGDAGGGADVFARFFPIGERLAEQHVKERHQPI